MVVFKPRQRSHDDLFDLLKHQQKPLETLMSLNKFRVAAPAAAADVENAALFALRTAAFSHMSRNNNVHRTEINKSVNSSSFAHFQGCVSTVYKV